jgi:hypothetical protein
MDGTTTFSFTLSDLAARHKEDPSIDSARRGRLTSGIYRVSDIIGIDPRTTPASMQFLRPLVAKVHPAKHNISPKTWSNLTGYLRAALLEPVPREPRQPDAEWERLRATLPNKRFRAGLSRFIGFCERGKIPPSTVCDDVSARFRIHLETDTWARPSDCHRCTCRLWNAAMDSIPGWPQLRLRLPDHRRPRRTLPLSAYPENLQQELKQCIAPPRRGHRFAKDGHKKVFRPSTIRKMTYECELVLSALVEAGRDPASITSLNCLFEPDAFETVLRRYCLDDEDETPRPTARNLGSTLITLAKRSLRSGAAALSGCRNASGRSASA